MPEVLAGILAFTRPPEGFEAPGTEIFKTPCLIGGGDYCFNRVSLLMVVAALVVIGLFLVAFSRPKMVPTGLQNVMESVVEFVRNGIALEVIGPAGLPWVPFLATMFVFIFVNNIFSILPLINFPTTSRMAIPPFLAVLAWFMFNIAGIRAQGLRYFRSTLFPPGVPKALYVLVTPIEFVSTFLVRPVTLTVRLLANMVAGHLILTIFFLGTTYLAFKPATIPFAVPAFALTLFLVTFEILVAVLQAYIFTILTAVYIAGAVHPEH
ncbi:MAG: F0F1 ATP synthase subunit A [Actinobacteria bacterium]|nr:F0F1 ATP synthase subunit A [Actinomycetota bacterium]